jgi:hypothetical protein
LQATSERAQNRHVAGAIVRNPELAIGRGRDVDGVDECGKPAWSCDSC